MKKLILFIFLPVLVFGQELGRFESGAGVLRFSGLTDVDTSGIADEKIAKYSSATGKWEMADDAGAGSGAPTDADYLVGTSNGGLSAEIVVGATPGGELGGTWASPTVDGGIFDDEYFELDDTTGTAPLVTTRKYFADNALQWPDTTQAGGVGVGTYDDIRNQKDVTEELTNKTINAANNTITNIGAPEISFDAIATDELNDGSDSPAENEFVRVAGGGNQLKYDAPSVISLSSFNDDLSYPSMAQYNFIADDTTVFKQDSWSWSIIDTVKADSHVVQELFHDVTIDSSVWEADDSVYVTLLKKDSWLTNSTRTVLDEFWVTTTKATQKTLASSSVSTGQTVVARYDSLGGRDAGAGVNKLTGAVAVKK